MPEASTSQPTSRCLRPSVSHNKSSLGWRSRGFGTPRVPPARTRDLPNTQQMLLASQRHEGLSATTFLWLALSPARVPPDIFLCFFSPLLPNVQFACLAYKSKTLWGRYFSDCLFVLAEPSAGFSKALTYNSLTAFFCLKHYIFLSDSEHFRT